MTVEHMDRSVSGAEGRVDTTNVKQAGWYRDFRQRLEEQLPDAGHVRDQATHAG